MTAAGSGASCGSTSSQCRAAAQADSRLLAYCGWLSRAAAGGHPHRTSPEIGGPYSPPSRRRSCRASCVALRRPATRAAASPPGLGSGTHSSALITQSGCVRRLVITPAGRYLFEGRASVGKNNGCARCRLVASNNDIDVEWIELDAAAHPPGILGSDQGRPRAEEGVQNNLAAVCQVDQRVLQHCGWFHSRMIL